MHTPLLSIYYIYYATHILLLYYIEVLGVASRVGIVRVASGVGRVASGVGVAGSGVKVAIGRSEIVVV